MEISLQKTFQLDSDVAALRFLKSTHTLRLTAFSLVPEVPGRVGPVPDMAPAL